MSYVFTAIGLIAAIIGCAIPVICIGIYIYRKIAWGI